MPKLLSTLLFLGFLLIQFRYRKRQFNHFLNQTRNQQGQLTILLCNQAAIPLAHNLLSSCQKQRVSNIGIICLDHRTQRYFQNLNIPNWLFPNPYTISPVTYGTKQFYFLTLQKWFICLQILKSGHHLLFLDSDIVLHKNPYPYFQGQADIYMQSDLTTFQAYQHQPLTNLNTGFMYINSNHRTITWFNQVLAAAIKSQDYLNDQIYFNDLFQSQDNPIRIKALPQHQFVNGAIYWGPANSYSGPYDLLPNTPASRKQIVAIHNNWIEGLQQKIDRFQASDLWFYQG